MAREQRLKLIEQIEKERTRSSWLNRISTKNSILAFFPTDT